MILIKSVIKMIKLVKKRLQSKSLDIYGIEVKEGERIIITIPYSMFVGSIRGFRRGATLPTNNPEESILRGDFISLRGYKGVFLVESICDTGWGGYEIAHLVRAKYIEGRKILKVGTFEVEEQEGKEGLQNER